jgi:hypothetical protein
LRCTACILAKMSCETLSPLPRLEMVGAFVRGFRAALMLPSGVDEKVMFAVAAGVVDDERMAGRSGDSSGGAPMDEGLEGSAGDDGEGEPKGEGESNSSGVVTGDAIADEESVCGRGGRVLRPQGLRGRVGEPGSEGVVIA